MRAIAFAVALPWLASACSTMTPPSGADRFPARLQALGTEPFWSIAIDGSRISYSTPDRPDGRTGSVSRSETGQALTFTGMLAGEPIAATITRGACSDGMSDRSYPYSARIHLGELLLQGCARPDGLP